MVHASLRAIGEVEGRAQGVVSALDLAAGPDGTVLMNLGARDDLICYVVAMAQKSGSSNVWTIAMASWSPGAKTTSDSSCARISTRDVQRSGRSVMRAAS